MTGQAREPRSWLWIATLVLLSLGLSRAFSCITPFAAIAAYAAAVLPRRQALWLVTLVWLGNQLIGFGLMGYPHTLSTVGWGLAIGLATVVALLGAAMSTARAPSTLLRCVGALPVAFALYEGVLLLATTVLPSGPGSFTMAVLLRVLAIDGVALLLVTALDPAVRLIPNGIPHRLAPSA